MLKLNVGFTKKVGEANYGSRGATVNLELELDSGLATDPDRLKDRIRQLFVLARASVAEELNGQTPTTNGHNGHVTNGNGHANGNGQSQRQPRDNTRKATASQVRAINAIAAKQRIDLAGLLNQRFGTTDANELSITEASALIDELKSPVNGQGGQR